MGICFLFKQSVQGSAYGKKIAGAGNVVISPSEMQFELADAHHSANRHAGAADFGFGAEFAPAHVIIPETKVKVLAEHTCAAYHRMPRLFIAQGLFRFYV